MYPAIGHLSAVSVQIKVLRRGQLGRIISPAEDDSIILRKEFKI